MKDNKTKVITIAALVIAIIALSIGFAAFSSTLNISTSAHVTPTDTFSVKFASGITGSEGSFTDFSVTPTVSVQKTASGDAIAGTPSIDNSDVKNPTIGNLSASFTAPGQSVTYTFYVVNDGNYDAYLTNVVFNNASNHNSFKQCLSNASSDNPATQSLVDSICNNITFTMSIGSRSNITGSETLSNHLLVKNHYETVTVVIAYTGEAYADGAFKVNFGDIGLNYRTIDEPEVVATQDIPVTPEEEIIVGDLVPTTEERNGIIAEENKYYFIDGEKLYFYEIDNMQYVYISYNDKNYIWICNEDTALSYSQYMQTTFEANVWYVSNSPEFPKTIYTDGTSPFSLNDFSASEIKNEDYVKRVIASFSN